MDAYNNLVGTLYRVSTLYLLIGRYYYYYKSNQHKKVLVLAVTATTNTLTTTSFTDQIYSIIVATTA